jgi:hypothetical protein
MQYQDDFVDSAIGWLQEEFDNYNVGYYELEYYHVDVRAAQDRRLVTTPDKKSYGDLTDEIKVFTEPNNTAASGDFRYGMVLRRAGDQYYAFTISPRTKQWYVLKSSPSALVVLNEGSDDSIQGLEKEDTLRVDAKGSTFFFHINDHLVAQVNDPDYAEGEVGFYVQTLDSPRAHIHFDSIAIQDVDAPQLKCTVIATALRIRSGPGTSFSPVRFLPTGEEIEVLGRSEDGKWLQVKVGDGDGSGWVYNSKGFESCDFNVADLPVASPTIRPLCAGFGIACEILHPFFERDYARRYGMPVSQLIELHQPQPAGIVFAGSQPAPVRAKCGDVIALHGRASSIGLAVWAPSNPIIGW